MKRVPSLLVLSLFVLSIGFVATAYAQSPAIIASRTAEINGVNLHYLTAGHGNAPHPVARLC